MTCSNVMQEPAYILKNGKQIPYIPATITTSRDAYAASLHVLFKHVADFHICIVKTFSAKYGIPEDDILKTIQESDEFKNMHVDPVLDTLGYLDSIEPMEHVKEVPAPKPDPIVVTEKSRPVEERESDPSAIKTKTIRKKIVAPKTDVQIPTPIIVAEHDIRPADEPELIKTKTILKKIVQKPTQPATTAITAASSVPTTAEDAPRKIIKKKTKNAE